MFSRRKRRPEDEDPLVPHGLVWQSTDEPEKPSVESDVSPKRPGPAVEMSILRNALESSTGGPVKTLAEESTRGKLGAISPPIPWPSPKTASVIRRSPPDEVPPLGQLVDLSASNNQPASSTTEPVRAPAANQLPRIDSSFIVGIPDIAARPLAATDSAAPKNGAVEIIELESADAPKKSLKSHLFRSALLTFRETAAIGVITAKRRLSSAFVKIQAASASGSARLKAGTYRAGSIVQTCLRQTGSALASGGAILRSWVAARSTQIGRVVNSVKAPAPRTYGDSGIPAGSSQLRTRSRRVRIKVQKSARVQKVLTQGAALWSAGRVRFQRERRLWTSMAMAALSALLAVGVISAVGPYAPRTNAARPDSQQARKDSAAASTPVSPRLHPASAEIAHGSSADVELSKTSSTPAQAQAGPKPKPSPRRDHRVSDEDDYVAPDTYHYYGASGSR